MGRHVPARYRVSANSQMKGMTMNYSYAVYDDKNRLMMQFGGVLSVSSGTLAKAWSAWMTFGRMRQSWNAPTTGAPIRNQTRWPTNTGDTQ